MHEIKVMSLNNLIGAKDYINREKHLIIQIQHHGVNDYTVTDFPNTIRNTILTFDDVNKDDKGFISKLDVSMINAVAYYLHMIDNSLPLYVCCFGGLSRSPAVAMGIMSYLIDKGHQEYKAMLEDCYKTHPHFNVDVVGKILESNREVLLTKEVSYKCPLCLKQIELKNVDMDIEHKCTNCGYYLTNKDILAHTLDGIKGFPDTDLEIKFNKEKKKHWWNKSD